MHNKNTAANPFNFLNVFHVDSEKIKRNFIQPDKDFEKFVFEDINQSIVERFETQAAKYPANIAVKSISSIKNLVYTYQELNEITNIIAHAIGDYRDIDNKVSNKSAQIGIGLLFEHGAEMIAAMLGVLKSGNFYIPLDPTYPLNRLQYILKDSDARIILTNNINSAFAQKLANGSNISIQVLNIENMDLSSMNLSVENPGIKIDPSQAAYILYTSGSTGIPKGVVQNHRNVLHFMSVYTNNLHINHDDRLTLLSSYGFDAAVMDIYGALLNGAAVYPYNIKETGKMAEMMNWLCVEEITIYHSVPTVFRLFTDELTGHDQLPSIRLIVLGGEEVIKKDFLKFKTNFPAHCLFINGLGPTESTVTLQNIIDKKTEIRKELVPVGFPVDRTNVYLLNEDDKEADILQEGEIIYASEYLALGYLNNPEKTNEVFGINPVKGNGRIYRSGDFGKRLPDGAIEFIGRRDFQVKIKGQRIELPEIESIIDKIPGIKKSIVTCHKYANDDNFLVGYYVKNKEIIEADIYETLRSSLPEFMVPRILKNLDSFPLTPTGKIDRKALPQPDSSWLMDKDIYVAPANVVEQKLVDIWKEILRLEQIGVCDNFFQSGGHSLKATILVSKIHQAFDVSVPLAEIFKNPTIREFAHIISSSLKTHFVDLEPVEEKDYYEPSFNQKRLWFIHQMNPSGLAFNMPGRIELAHKVKDEWIENTLSYLFQRHESFRTYFKSIDGEPIQCILNLNEIPVNLSKIDISYMAEKEKQQEQEQIFTKLAGELFGLAQPPLFRLVLLKLAEQQYELMFNMHHIITDGWSMEIIKKDFYALYEGQRTGKTIDLELLPFRYRDFAEWQNAQLNDPLKKSDSYQFWKMKLQHGIPEFILPADFSRGRESKAGATYTYFIDQNITQKIKQLAERQNTTLFTVMFSIYIILLSRLSGQKEVVCSIISAGREHPSLYSIVGFFVNSIIYFTNVSFKTPFDNFLDKMKTDTIDLFQHQAYPLEKIFEELGLKYPDITISFNMLHIRDSAAAVEFKAAESLPFHSENYHDTKFDLEPYVTEYKNGIHINWSYKKNVFKPGTIAFIADEYIKIIDFFTNNPSKSYIEYRKQISEVKPTVQQNIQTLSIAFANQVEKIPNHIAIKVGIQHFTYAELDKYSNGIACLIQGSLKASNRNNKRIGLFFEHGYDMVASIIGTLKSGNSYVPLSVSYPLIRLSYILADSESSLILTNIKNLPTAARLAEENHIRLANVGEVKEFSPQRLDISGQSLAYILYTSGSTGNPKGVIQNHENILYYIHNWSRIFSITPEDKMTLFSSFSHDGSVQDMFGALLNGATLNVFDVKNREENAPNLSAFLIKEKITIWHSVPSLFNYFVNNIDNYGKAENFGHLRFILLGGEPLREHEMTMSAKYFPYSTLANIYGQTESSVNSIWLIPSESYKNYNGLFKIVIGKPLDNTVIVLMDEEDNILGPLETGEIMVACPHLALGYWKNEEFNQKSFFIHPTYGRMYRTGDWGRLLPDGNIEFIGRKDNQVKIRGFRIELGEIESQLLKYKGVKGSVVIFKIDEREEPNLVAYIVSENDIPQSNLREYLLAHLPDYMIPLHFIKLEKFPLTSTGKIDRKALPGPEMKNSDGYSAPRNIIEKKLVEIWEEVLGKPASMSIGIDNNFFQLGGHSLKATILTAKIHKALHVNIPLTKIFKTPTIRSLANYIKTAIKDKYLSIEPVEKKEYYPLSSAQKRLYILYQMEREGIEYNIPSISVLDGEIHIDKLERIFKQLILRHESLKTSFHMINDEPVQKIHDNVKFEIEKLEGRGAPPWSPDIIRNYIRPFDLSKASLLRVGLLKEKGEKGDRHILMIDMHHIISDGTSMNILVKDFIALYQDMGLSELGLQYKDYSSWQNSKKHEESIKQQEHFWINEFAGEIPVLELPTDYLRPVVQNFEGSRIRFEIDKNITDLLKKLTIETDVTLYILLLSMYTVFLSKLTNQEDIVIGSPIAGRRHADLENIIGMFVNTLAFRNYPLGKKTFIGFLQEVKERTLSALENQDYQYEELVEVVALSRDVSRNPLFDTMLVLQNFDTQEIKIPGLKLAPYEYENKTSKFDLTLTGI
ncbi:MAG TPA: amino acid adenylation domain-containing protein, partial [Candidatus Kapabacteria bacterium]|nr:amino acid adenylation domain-containing protein [Candidatus Kapabacteria bacterium]